MASILEQQKELIQSIYKKIQDEKDNMDKMYSGFINKLEGTNPNQQLYKDIDELFLSKVEPAKEFVNSFTENDTELVYWYDMNEKKFINKLHDYNSKIIIKYDFDLYVEDKLFHNVSTVNKITIPLKKWNFEYTSIFQPQPQLGITTQTKQIGNLDISCKLQTGNHNLYNANKIEGLSLFINLDNPTSTKLKIYLDNYLNIIIPAYNTIIINNYVKFPYYALYSIYKELNISEVFVFNKHNEDDMNSFNKINNVITNLPSSYLTSYDHRKTFDNGNMFNDILDFIKHKKMMDLIKPQLDFMASLKLENSDKKVNDVEEVLHATPQTKQTQQPTLVSSSYDDILFQQIKDLQNQLEICKKEKEEINKKFNDMKLLLGSN